MKYTVEEVVKSSKEKLSDDYTNKEIRVGICKIIGVRIKGRVLTKKALNSIHFYLTGEYSYPKEENYTRRSSKSIGEVRMEVAEEVSIDDTYGGTFDLLSKKERVENPRPFKKEELCELLDTLRETDDKRPVPDS